MHVCFSIYCRATVKSSIMLRPQPSERKVRKQAFRPARRPAPLRSGCSAPQLAAMSTHKTTSTFKRCLWQVMEHRKLWSQCSVSPMTLRSGDALVSLLSTTAMVLNPAPDKLYAPTMSRVMPATLQLSAAGGHEQAAGICLLTEVI